MANGDDKIAELEAQVLESLKEGEQADSEEATAAITTETADKPNEQTDETTEDPSVPTDETTISEEDDLSQLKPKGQERVQALANENTTLKSQVDKLPELEKEIKRLQSLLGIGNIPGRSGTTLTPQNENQLPWQEGREMTQEELKAVIKSEAQEEYANQRTLDTLQYDIQTVEDAYPELRAPSDEVPNPDFDETLTNNITKWYETLFNKDRSLRFSDFVSSIMSLKAKGEEAGRAKAQANAAQVLKQQAAEDVIDGDSAVTKDKGGDLSVKIKGARNSSDLAALEKLLPHAD